MEKMTTATHGGKRAFLVLEETITDYHQHVHDTGHKDYLGLDQMHVLDIYHMIHEKTYKQTILLPSKIQPKDMAHNLQDMVTKHLDTTHQGHPDLKAQDLAPDIGITTQDNHQEEESLINFLANNMSPTMNTMDNLDKPTTMSTMVMMSTMTQTMDTNKIIMV